MSQSGAGGRRRSPRTSCVPRRDSELLRSPGISEAIWKLLDSHTVSKSGAGVEMSNERSLLGTSLAAETSFQQFFWNQRFKPGFLESLVCSRLSRRLRARPPKLL